MTGAAAHADVMVFHQSCGFCQALLILPLAKLVQALHL
tara:strand:+ start:256 stop:369 length:114 start_codon:yes stop_codon:yes gene_type:complete